MPEAIKMEGSLLCVCVAAVTDWGARKKETEKKKKWEKGKSIEEQ